MTADSAKGAAGVGPVGSEAGATLRAMALTTTAIGYAPGVTAGGDTARDALAKARRDARRYALAAWAAGGRPTGDEALYGALLRSGGAYADAVGTHFGLAPVGEVLAADVAPEGHKLAVLAREKGAKSARVRVLAFGEDAAAPTWSTIGPDIDPEAAFALSDCGGMFAFAEPDGHREVWNMMGAEPVKVFESNGGGVDLAAGERQFLDFNDDTHRLLYAHGPAGALRGEVVAVHQAVPIVEGDVALPRGGPVGEVRLDGAGPAAVTVPAGSGGGFLTRYGDRVTAGTGGRIRVDASYRYLVERHGSAEDVHAVRVTDPRLGRVYRAVLPVGTRVGDLPGGRQALLVPVRADARTLRMIVVTDGALLVVDAPRVDEADAEAGADERGLPGAAALVAEACGTSPTPLTDRELALLPAVERGTARAWPCD
ncbi:hypothetical protein ACN20G_26865 (plasmid) [Streptomyces sp. BI20]|uniref:hypothetical protein n=1 Tax=Streptomyces sp. BI20 TaxID=3403460 RepID=UPI003C786590